MEQIPVDVLCGQICCFQCLQNGLRHFFYRKLKYFSTVHIQIIHWLLLWYKRIVIFSVFHIDRTAAGSVASLCGCDHTALCCTDNCGTGSVSKQHTGGAITPVHNAG